MLNWLKGLLCAQAIQRLDELEEPIALKIKEAQKKLGEIPPEEFAKLLIDDFQLFLCKKLKVDPKRIGLEA